MMSFSRKMSKSLNFDTFQLRKNDVTVPKAMLITSKDQFKQPLASDGFIFEQFCLQTVTETDFY